MTSLLVNLSMLGPRVSGLHVYADRCAQALEARLAITVLSSVYKPRDARTALLDSPAEVGMGYGRLAGLRRAIYLAMCRPPHAKQPVYSPTHHGLVRAARQIITIHDLIPLRHPDQHRMQAEYYRHVLSRLVKKVDAVFTVSEVAKREIEEFMRVREERIFVVPNGVDQSVFRPLRVHDRRGDYLLMVGASYPHKNVEEVLRNAELWVRDALLKIVAPPGPHVSRLKRLTIELGLQSRVEFVGPVGRDELATLYREALALIYPSFWEGFGIPPLEALASGTPVIVSDIPVHREVLGDAAIYVTLGSRDSWADALAHLGDTQRIEARMVRGRARVQHFSWERSAERLWTSIRDVFPDVSR